MEKNLKKTIYVCVCIYIYIHTYIHIHVYICKSESISCSVVSSVFATPCAAALQALLSMQFSRQEHWSG